MVEAPNLGPALEAVAQGEVESQKMFGFLNMDFRRFVTGVIENLPEVVSSDLEKSTDRVYIKNVSDIPMFSKESGEEHLLDRLARWSEHGRMDIQMSTSEDAGSQISFEATNGRMMQFRIGSDGVKLVCFETDINISFDEYSDIDKCKLAIKAFNFGTTIISDKVSQLAAA